MSCKECDVLLGGSGDDVFDGASTQRNGADVYDGDAGTDRADYSHRMRDVVAQRDGIANDGENERKTTSV